MTNDYVAYYRVSTKLQNYGLDVQKDIVKSFLKNNKGVLIGEYEEKETAKNDRRIELNKAIDLCQKKNATLLIAKLDRLSRNASFIFSLRDSKVKFQAIDIPDANTLTIGIFATIAQHEREIISERTKSGLLVAKKKGVLLGNPKLRNDTDIEIYNEYRKKGLQKVREIANIRDKQVIELAKLYRDKGYTLKVIADKLNEIGFKSPRGCTIVSSTVSRYLKE